MRLALLFFGVAMQWACSAIAEQPAQSADTRVADLMSAGKIRMGVFPSFQYSKDNASGEPWNHASACNASGHW